MFSRWMQWGRARPNLPARRVPARVCLGLEALEDRLVPTLSYSQWQAERFQIDDVAVANVGAQANAAPQPVNQSFGSLIGLDRAFADYAFRGQGYSVAVIDTGIDYRHVDLGGGWGRRVVAGYDFVNHDNDPLDDNGHGTHVAGIIGGSSTTYSGVAPNVNLIALKVLDANGSGSFGNIEAALQWVAAHQAQYNIVAVNMSLGSGNYTSNPYAFLDDEFAALNNEGVFIAVAAGNSFYTYGSQIGLAYPAADPAVVAVGAVWAKDFGQVSWMSGARDITTGPDHVASFSQRGPGLDLLAPGALITSTYLNGAYQSMAGTSMAAPVVAGAAVLLHQALDAQHLAANQAAILQLLRSSGATVMDGDDENDNVANSGLSFPRLDVANALHSVAGPVGDAAPTLQAIADQSISPGSWRTITLVAADPNGDPITLAARVVAAGNELYSLRQQLGLTFLGDYFTNVWGQNEKWLGGNGGAWYCILPSGALRRWAGTMNATLEAGNLIATVSAACYADPSLLWNAQATGAAPITLSLAGNQLTLNAVAGASGTCQVEVTASDGSHTVARVFSVSVGNQAPVWTAIDNQTMSRADATRAVALQATDPEGDWLSYSAVARNGAKISLAIVGSQLTIAPAAGLVGTFVVEVTASDGANSSTTSFNVEIRNSAPVIGALADLTMRRNRRAYIAIPAFDGDGDALTYAAVARPANYLAYRLDQQLDLNFKGSYSVNYMGRGEKWMATKNPQGYQDWYCILPNGELRRHGGTLAATFGSDGLVAKLDPSYYVKPQKLWNATLQAAPNVNVAVFDNVVIVAPRPHFVGNFVIEVAASDGFTTTWKTFNVRVLK